MLESFGRGMDDELAGIAIDDRRSQGRDFENGIAEAHDGRDAEGPSENGGVGVDAASFGDKAEELTAVH